MAKKNKINWAIVGLGTQAHRIANAIEQASNAKLIAVVSSSNKHAKDFAKQYKVKYPYTSYAQLLRNKDIDAVFVASVTNLHKKHCLMALKAGKHVMCEKPIAASLDDAKAIYKAAQKSKSKFGIGYHLRHHPIYTEIRKILKSKKIGKINFIEMDWSVGNYGEKMSKLNKHMQWRENPKQSGGGAIMARGNHLFDLIRLITDKEVSRVSAQTINIKNGIDVTATGVLELGSILTNITTSKVIPNARNEIKIFGTDGTITVKNPYGGKKSAQLIIETPKKKYTKKYKNYNMWAEEIRNFGNAIKNKKTFRADAADGLIASQIIDAFITSAKTKKTIKL